MSDDSVLREALENCQDGYTSLKYRCEEEKKELIEEVIRDINGSIFERLTDKLILRKKWQNKLKNKI